MSTASERAKDRRSLRLEVLEDRQLLSTAHANLISAEAVKAASTTTTSLVGQVQAQPAPAGLYVTVPSGTTSYSGHGTVRPGGEVLFGAAQVGTLNAAGTSVSITQGHALLTTFHKGSNLYLSYTGTGKVVAHKPIALSLHGTVTSGTGAFLGETGTFAAFGTLNPTTGRLAVTYSIILNHAATV
jgi:hypothetical protein